MRYRDAMAEIDLRRLSEDEFVIHFGGRPNEVNAFTFSNSLIALSEALQEINKQTNPELGIEVAIEGVGPGSFRAKLKTRLKSLGGLFKRTSEGVIVGVLATLICQRLFPDSPISISVDESQVVLQRGHDRIIIPKGIWEALKKNCLIPHKWSDTSGAPSPPWRMTRLLVSLAYLPIYRNRLR